MMLLKLIIICIILISFAFLCLGVQIFFSKKKSFPQTHISENENMQKLKIKCAKINTCDDNTSQKSNLNCKSCCLVNE